MTDSATRWDAIAPEPATAAAPASVADRWDAIAPAAPPPKGDAAALGTDTQNALAGAGKAVVDMGRGAKQILDIPAVWLEKRFPGISKWSEVMGTPTAAQSAAATDADVAESRARDAPLMDTKAGLGGNIGGAIATTMVPLSAIAKTGSVAAKALLNPTTYKAAAASGAVQGALQPVTGDESRITNTGVGAVAGMAGNAIVNTVGRVVQPVKDIVSAAHAKAVQVLEDAGIPLDAAQKTGSAFLNKLRSSFTDNPFTAGAQAEQSATQKAAYNRAILRTIGEDATAATPEVMGAAAKRINGVFKDVLDRNNVAVNDSLLARIGVIQKAANEEEKKPVANIANRIVGAVDDTGAIKGQVAYDIKKDLDRLASSSDSTLAYHARQLRSTLMDAINGSLNDADRKAFSEARGQFANMKKIESTIDREGHGDISPAKLANVFGQKANRNISIYGNGPQDLHDLAQAGNMLLPDKTPNSGTAARLAMQIALPAVAGSAEYAHAAGDEKGSEAGRTIGAIAAGIVAPKVAQKIMSSPRMANYIAEGAHGSMTPIRDLLMLPQTNAAVGGAARRALPAYEQTRAK